jgi:hypothetical protein
LPVRGFWSICLPLTEQVFLLYCALRTASSAKGLG